MTEYEAELMGEWTGLCNSRIKSTKILKVFKKMLKMTAINEREEDCLIRAFELDYKIACSKRMEANK